MTETSELLRLIQPDREKIEQVVTADLREISTAMDMKLMEILEYGLFSGGKRFRPLLAVVAARMAAKDSSNAYRLAIAFEYLHLATLFHDDVIDRAETRRGKATVVKQYGISAAILAGDFLHARSMEIVGRYGGIEALEVFCSVTRGMVHGEFLQLRNATNFNQSAEDYFAAIHGKTALLISAAAEIGGIIGGASAQQRQALREYGTNLGYGFQIADDLLDYLGDEKKTGKAVGNDLAEGKMTLPIVYALELAGDNDRQRLREILRSVEERKSAFREVKRIIEKYNAFARTRTKAEFCIAKAIEALSVFLPDKKAEVDILTGLAAYALTRDK